MTALMWREVPRAAVIRRVAEDTPVVAEDTQAVAEDTHEVGVIQAVADTPEVGAIREGVADDMAALFIGWAVERLSTTRFILGPPKS